MLGSAVADGVVSEVAYDIGNYRAKASLCLFSLVANPASS